MFSLRGYEMQKEKVRRLSLGSWYLQLSSHPWLQWQLSVQPGELKCSNECWNLSVNLNTMQITEKLAGSMSVSKSFSISKRDFQFPPELRWWLKSDWLLRQESHWMWRLGCFIYLFIYVFYKKHDVMVGCILADISIFSAELKVYFRHWR